MSRNAIKNTAAARNEVESTVRKFVASLKDAFAEEITRDPRAFKKTALRLVRRQLPPRPGRPTRPEIEAAIVMYRQGKTVREILRIQVPGFDELDSYHRWLSEKALRQAILRRQAKRPTPQP